MAFDFWNSPCKCRMINGNSKILSKPFWKKLTARSGLFLRRTSQREAPSSQGVLGQLPEALANPALCLSGWTVGCCWAEALQERGPADPCPCSLSSTDSHRDGPSSPELFSRREGERTSSKEGKPPKLLFQLSDETLIRDWWKFNKEAQLQERCSSQAPAGQAAQAHIIFLFSCPLWGNRVLLSRIKESNEK